MTVSRALPQNTSLLRFSGAQRPVSPVFSGKRLLADPVKPAWNWQSAVTTAGTFPLNGPPAFNAAFHKDRRDALLAMLPADTTVVMTGNREFGRNYDVGYEFRQDSNFYYLTGFDEPDAVAVFSNVAGQPRYSLFVRPRNEWREAWDGERAGVEGAKNIYGANEAYSADHLAAKLPGLLSGAKRLMWAPSEFNTDLNTQAQKILRAANKAKPPLKNIAADIHQLRTVKTPYEIALMKRACEVSAKGHTEAMKKAPQLLSQNGHLNEGQIEALAEYHFRDQGSERTGYSSIAPGGSRTCTLHYITNRKNTQSGDLVLVDAGAEYGYYTADITRTWPVNGKFTPEQKAIYDIVLDAQESGIQMVKPGVTLKEIHENSVRKVTEGLVKLGLLKGDVDDLIKSGAYFKYFMHGTSHMMGLDVHDVNLTSGQGTTAIIRNAAKQARDDITQKLVDLGVLEGDPKKLSKSAEYFKYFVMGGDALGVPQSDQADLNKGFAQLSGTRGHGSVPVEAGMVFSVEPGIYIPADDMTVDAKWRGIGVRIEDDILVTPTGHENLSGMIPRTTNDIEALMAPAVIPAGPPPWLRVPVVRKPQA